MEVVSVSAYKFPESGGCL